MIIATIETENRKTHFHNEYTRIFDTAEEFRKEIEDLDYKTIVKRLWELKDV